MKLSLLHKNVSTSTHWKVNLVAIIAVYQSELWRKVWDMPANYHYSGRDRKIPEYINIYKYIYVLCRRCSTGTPIHRVTTREPEEKDQPYKCAAEHPCFHAFCLYPRMLAVREASYRKGFGRTLPGSWDHNTKMRYIAYRVWYSW